MRVKNTKQVQLWLTLGVSGAILCGVSLAHADMNSYRLYNAKSGQHYWTTSGSEKQSLMKTSWKYEGIGWASVNSGKTKIYRLYNSKNKYHFYTDNSKDITNLKKGGYKVEGIFGYSSGKIPVYRLRKNNKPWMWTSSTKEIKTLEKQGYVKEGVAFYTIAPEYSWSYDATQGSQSGQPNDVHFPQFDYLTSFEGVTKTYQGNNTFYAYNDAVFNFNAQLQTDAKSADYADAQARRNWTNLQKQDQLAVSNAKAALDTATTKVDEAQTLVNQAQSDVTVDQQHNLDATQDQALLTQYQASLTAAQTVYNTDNTTYQNAVNTLTTLNKQGTNYVQLSYKMGLDSTGKTVTVNFTKTTRSGGNNTKSSFSRSATLAAD